MVHERPTRGAAHYRHLRVGGVGSQDALERVPAAGSAGAGRSSAAGPRGGEAFATKHERDRALGTQTRFLGRFAGYATERGTGETVGVIWGCRGGGSSERLDDPCQFPLVLCTSAEGSVLPAYLVEKLVDYKQQHRRGGGGGGGNHPEVVVRGGDLVLR